MKQSTATKGMSIGDIVEPRTHHKTEMQSLQYVDPTFHRIDCNTDFIGEVGIDELLSRALGENMAQCLQ